MLKKGRTISIVLFLLLAISMCSILFYSLCPDSLTLHLGLKAEQAKAGVISLAPLDLDSAKAVSPNYNTVVLKNQTKSLSSRSDPSGSIISLEDKESFEHGLVEEGAAISNGEIILKRDRVDVNIQYPIIGNKLIDLELANWASNQNKTFVSEVESFKEADRNANFDYSLYIDYKIFRTAKTVSIIFNTSTFTGGAHPSHGQISFVFNTGDANKLDLLDLFQAEEKAVVSTITTFCYNRLRANLAKLGFEVSEDSLPAELDSISVFALDKSGLLIFFEPYQVAPYSFGYQTVSISLKDLESLKLRSELWQAK